MTITVKEKEHWKNRITRKIDKAVEALLDTAPPNIMEEIKRKAKDRALKSLGLAELTKEVEKIDAKRNSLDKQLRAVYKRMLAVVLKVDVNDVIYPTRFGEPYELQTAIQRRQDVVEQEILAGDEFGKRILRLQHEKEELLDTVWLATSPTQIKELWTTVSDVLDQEPTELQKEALNIEPTDSSKE